MNAKKSCLLYSKLSGVVESSCRPRRGGRPPPVCLAEPESLLDIDCKLRGRSRGLRRLGPVGARADSLDNVVDRTTLTLSERLAGEGPHFHEEGQLRQHFTRRVSL